MRLGIGLLALVVPAGHLAAAPVPEPLRDVLVQYCADCHDDATSKGGVNLDQERIDWQDPAVREHWLKAHEALERGLMPPVDKPQPPARERDAVAEWLRDRLLEHTPIGGTLPRRLNREEYQATVRKLLGLPQFELPQGFPREAKVHGFTNLGEGLVLSPPLLEAYSQVASGLADELFPPAREQPEPKSWTAGPEDMVISFSASSVRDGVLRLASRSTTAMRSCTWPSRIEITTSGRYRVTVEASSFRPKSGEAMVLEVHARDLAASDRTRVDSFRLLETIEVDAEDPSATTFEADLYEGQTVLFRWANAEMDHAPKPLSELMRNWFERDKRWLAAWQAAVFPDGTVGSARTTSLRGRNGWDVVKKHLADPELNLANATMESALTRKLLQLLDSSQGTFNLADALCNYYFEHGPSLELHEVRIEGPLALVEGPRDKRRKSLQKAVFGDRTPGQSDEDFLRAGLRHFLPRAFRRPVDADTIEAFLSIASRHWAEGNGFEEGVHLVLRSILVSPRFLHRALHPGPLDDHDLAVRLSYFLTQGPPDATLIDLANRGRLSEDWVLRREALRLLPKKATDPALRSFTGQWLGLDLLPGIMPDPVFRFTPYYVEMARSEVEHFFAAMLRENRPMTDFIDPDFTYTSPLFAREVYKLTVAGSGKKNAAQKRALQRVPLARGGRHGGLLGQSGVMMATANGVDTQPVLRGVWVLENILGYAPPPPPENVPALTPDTQGATTPRELLAAHTGEASCAGCHRHIDPLGFLLESYDPVGRWREKWPKSGKTIDPVGVLPDGTRLEDATALKRWLVQDIDRFSECLAGKLLTYATGRVPNIAEREEISALVVANRVAGKGFRDLVLDLVASETFRTK